VNLNLNSLDIVILCIIGICVIRGFIRGFLAELISFIVFVSSLLIANYYYPRANEYFFQILPKSRYIPLISFAFLFVISYAGLSMITWIIKAIFIEGGASGSCSRIFGVLTALLKATIAIYLFIILLTFFIPSKNPIITKSKLAPVVIKSYQKIIAPMYPSAVNKFKQKFMTELKKIKKRASEIGK